MHDQMKENAPAAGGAAAAGGACTAGGRVHSYINIGATNIQPVNLNKIYEHLPRGAENAITGKTLAVALGMSWRSFRAEVARERLNGAIICSGPHGYYRPINTEEIRTFVRSMHHRARMTEAVLSAARAALPPEPKPVFQVQGQLALDDLVETAGGCGAA